MINAFDEYQLKVAGTNIDPRSLLSTDYFNTFNSVIMLFDMLPESPELLEEAERWQFYDYVEHFKISGLDFADLAIAAYAYVPPPMLQAFEVKINDMRLCAEKSIRELRRLHDAGETQAFTECVQSSGARLRSMMDEAGCIIHGSAAMLDQSTIDDMFDIAISANAK